ncbi:hypothetical protein [Desulfosporosinus sp. SB140]|uniref:hypothetical protein n=1 Tax=Desulfosporosinus paludis TaxID=3115649 RepID=UPI003890395F
MQQVNEALTNENEVRIVKVKFQNGEVIRFDFEEFKVEVKNENDEDEDEDENEDDGDGDDDGDDGDDDDDDDDQEDHVEATSTISDQSTSETPQEGGWKVNK